MAYDDPYVQPLILSALSAVFPSGNIAITDSIPENFSLSTLGSSSNILNITSYETIDFEYASSYPSKCLINSYMIRKALIRKHYLSTTIDHWTAKNPKSILKTHVKRSEAFELDYAEFLDDALVEAFDLREAMQQNEAKIEVEREWWILKPGMSDRGQGIRLFSTMDELQSIFDVWEEDQPDTDDEEEDEDAGGDYITTSHLRHFVAQPYIHPPFLLSGHKFHIRTYVLCVGSLRVHVYHDMLALFAAKPYVPPSSSTSNDIESFLTNTCLQSSPNTNTVRAFWALPLPKSQLEDVFSQICSITGELFEGAARAMPIHFQTLPNAFEVFGLDFMVDEGGKTWLLEVNAFPDFKQTGGDLKSIVEGFWEGVVREAVGGFFGVEGEKRRDEGMVLVRDVDLGRR